MIQQMTNIELTEIDEEYLELISKGYSSPYAIWSYVQKNPTRRIKSVAYKNVNKRFNKLIDLQIIEPMKLAQNMHAAKHCRIDRKGLSKYVKHRREFLEQHIQRLELLVTD